MMFVRLLWRLLGDSRGRLAVALIALISGAMVSSALINLDLDIDHKLTREFRTLGANVVIAPRDAAGGTQSGNSAPNLMDAKTVLPKIVSSGFAEVIAAAPYLYLVVHSTNTPVVVAGTWLDQALKLQPTWKIEGSEIASRGDSVHCIVGRNVARQFHLSQNSQLELSYLGRTAKLVVAGVIDSGSADDNQIFVDLRVAQNLAAVPGRIELVQLSVNGSAAAIAAYASQLAQMLPQEDVRPIRQVTEAEGQLLNRTRLLIVSMIVLILALTSLCVLATMAALTTERREDVGLMKALGGSISRIMGLFLAEVGVLGVLGGFVGCVAGVALSRWMGHRVFATAITVRWEIFPLTIALMVVVALVGALPLRLLGKVKPAVILRGE